MSMREKVLPNSVPSQTPVRSETLLSTTLENAKPQSKDQVRNLIGRSVSGLVDEAFDLYKDHILELFLIVAIVLIPTQAILLVLERNWLQRLVIFVANAKEGQAVVESLILAIGYMFVGYPEFGIPGIISLCALGLATGPISFAVSDIQMNHPVKILSCFQRARRSYFRILMGWIMAGLAFVGLYLSVFTVLMIGLTFLMGLLASWLSDLPDFVAVISALILIIVPYVISALMLSRWFSLLPQVCALEGQSLIGFPTRVSDLVRKMRLSRAWWAAIILPFSLFVFHCLFLGAASSLTAVLTVSPLQEYLINAFVYTAVLLSYQPFWMIFLTLFYYDYRIQREGLDLLIMAEKLPPMPAWAIPLVMKQSAQVVQNTPQSIPTGYWPVAGAQIPTGPGVHPSLTSPNSPATPNPVPGLRQAPPAPPVTTVRNMTPDPRQAPYLPPMPAPPNMPPITESAPSQPDPSEGGEQ